MMLGCPMKCHLLMKRKLQLSDRPVSDVGGELKRKNIFQFKSQVKAVRVRCPAIWFPHTLHISIKFHVLLHLLSFLILKTTSKFWKVIKVLASCHYNSVETSTSIKNDRNGSKPGSTLPHSDQSEARLSESIESLTTSLVRSIPDILVHL